MGRYDSWRTLPLQSVVLSWFGGATPRRSNENYYSDQEHGLPWARVGDLQGRLLFETKEYVSEEALRGNLRPVPKGTVLLSTSGTIGKVAIAGRELTINQAIQGMLFNSEILLSEYAYYYFLFSKDLLLHMANAVTIPNLTRARLELFRISFPNLAEQREIVDKLMLVEDALVKQKQLVATYEAPLVSLLMKLLGPDIRHVQTKPLAELSESIIAGLRLKQSDAESNFALLNALPSNMLIVHDSSNSVKIEPSARAIERYCVLPGDVLIRRNIADGFAVAVLAGAEISNTILGANLIRVRTLQTSLLPEFLLAWLAMNRSRLVSTQNSAQFFDISAIRNLYIPHIPLPMQEKFADQFHKLCALQEKLVKASTYGERLFELMLACTFATAGQIVTPFINQGRHVQWEELFAVQPSKIEFIRMLSPFQQVLLSEFYSLKVPLAAHTALKNIKRKAVNKFNLYSVQDALFSVMLVANFGLIKELPPQKIPAQTRPAHEGEVDYLRDARARYITVRQYQAPEDLSEQEYAYETM